MIHYCSAYDGGHDAIHFAAQIQGPSMFSNDTFNDAAHDVYLISANYTCYRMKYMIQQYMITKHMMQVHDVAKDHAVK
jgi:hypothetical protein